MNQNEDLEKSIWGHINDLKILFFKLMFFWIISTSICWYYYKDISQIILRPLGDVKLILLSPTDGFMFILKTVTTTGLMLALPFVTIVVVQYLSLIFNPNGKKLLFFVSLTSLTMSYLGILYGYYSLIPNSIEFLTSIAPSGISFNISAMNYLDFLIFIYFMLVLIAQSPIVTFILLLNKIITFKQFTDKRRELYLGILVLCALITPTPDVVTLILVVIPNIFLIETSVICARFFLRNSKGHKQEESIFAL